MGNWQHGRDVSTRSHSTNTCVRALLQITCLWGKWSVHFVQWKPQRVIFKKKQKNIHLKPIWWKAKRRIQIRIKRASNRHTCTSFDETPTLVVTERFFKYWELPLMDIFIINAFFYIAILDWMQVLIISFLYGTIVSSGLAYIEK